MFLASTSSINKLKLFTIAFSVSLIFNVFWSTGGSFKFSEVPFWPNYNMLASAFARGETHITEIPAEDYVKFEGKRYLYYGPVPALVRLPFTLMLNSGMPTGLMIAICIAACNALFLLILLSCSGITDKGYGLLILAVLVLNGFTLFLLSFSIIHNEAIVFAMMFLLGAILIYVQFNEDEKFLSAWRSVLLGLCLSLAVGCRASYAFAAIAVGAFFLSHILRLQNRFVFKVKILLPFAVTAFCGALLLFYYNYARFGNFLDFGIYNQKSHYDHSQFISYSHIPYHLWSIFFRLPVLRDIFPYLSLPYFTSVTQFSGYPSGSLFYVNENSISIFILMPITALYVYSFVTMQSGAPDSIKQLYFKLNILLWLQILGIALTILTAVRFYYDFLPILLLMCAISAIRLQINKISFAGLCVLSVLISDVLLLKVAHDMIKAFFL